LTYSDFEQRLKYLGITPNFFCSAELFAASEWEVVDAEYGTRLEVHDNSMRRIFPLLTNPESHEYFCDFEELSPASKTTFLDYEYIYDPKTVMDMKGSSFRIFRKNINHFNSIYPKYNYHVVDPGDALNLLSMWLSAHEGETFFDVNTVGRYIIDTGARLKGIYNENKRLIGFNAWDENFMYVNFRFSFSYPLDRGISDKLRWCFYRDIATTTGKLVNDGGTLDKPSLKAFKDRLQPIIIKQRFSGV
jgi:hypothetical protein